MPTYDGGSPGKAFETTKASPKVTQQSTARSNLKLCLSKFLPMSTVTTAPDGSGSVKLQSVQSKVNQARLKLEKKAAKRIQLMRDSVTEQQNAYPCIFIKKKHVPESKDVRLKKLQDSVEKHQGVWFAAGNACNTVKLMQDNNDDVVHPLRNSSQDQQKRPHRVQTMTSSVSSQFVPLAHLDSEHWVAESVTDLKSS